MYFTFQILVICPLLAETTKQNRYTPPTKRNQDHSESKTAVILKPNCRREFQNNQSAHPYHCLRQCSIRCSSDSWAQALWCFGLSPTLVCYGPPHCDVDRDTRYLLKK